MTGDIVQVLDGEIQSRQRAIAGWRQGHRIVFYVCAQIRGVMFRHALTFS